MVYEYLDHSADIGIRVTSDSIENVFSEAARALFNIMYEARAVSPFQSYELRIHSTSIEFLIVEFLNEIISLIDRKEVFFSCCDNVIFLDSPERKTLSCVLKGEVQNLDKHEVKTEVKAATYSGLFFRKENDKFIFQCLLDI